MAIWLSLVAAVSYGLGDFIGGVSSQRAPAWAVALMAQVGGLAGAGVLALTLPGTPSGTDLAWGVLAGVGNGLGTAFLYRGLASGRMGVVAPVSGVGAAVVPVAAGLVLGERPGLVVWCGLLLALPAIWLVSRTPRQAGTSGPPPLAAPGAAGLLDGVIAGAGFGTLFVALSRVGADAGMVPLALNQVVAVVVVVVLATALRASWVPRRPAAYAGLISGVLGVTATVLFLLATRQGYLAVSAVITSLYPAFTVVLAAAVLRERVHRTQGVGLALCAGAVTLVAVG